MTTAIVFVPAEMPLDLYLSRCMAYCESRGYTFGGVLRDYTAGLQALLDSHASVIVVARGDHLDPNRVPRVEVVADAAPIGGADQQRRPTSVKLRPAVPPVAPPKRQPFAGRTTTPPGKKRRPRPL